MLKLASDEDVNGNIIRGLLRRRPDLDLLRAQDDGMDGLPDEEVLEWAASAGRILITNDRNTMIASAYQRSAADRPLPGVIATTNTQSIGAAIDDILIIAVCMTEDEVRDCVVVYLPL